MNKKQVFGALAALMCMGILLAGLSGCSSSTTVTTAAAEHSITVSASSEVKVTPDKAEFTISIITENDDADVCQEENAATVNEVIAALRALGIDDKNIQTAYTNLNPRYGNVVSDFDDERDYSYTEEWLITGYEMTTALTVSGIDINQVGVAIDAATAAGATETYGLSYYASTYDETYQAALEEAIAKAKQKAEVIASATGAKLGAVINVVEGYEDTSYRFNTTASYAMEATLDGAGSIAETMPGEVVITAQVTVSYAIG